MENYRELFISEGIDYINKINDALLQLEKDIENKEYIDEIFRSMHTLKGMAASMGYNAIVSVSHSCEDLFGKIKNGEIPIDTNTISNMFTIMDYLEELIYDEERSKGEIDDEIKSIINSLMAVKVKTGEKRKKKKRKTDGEGVSIVINLNEDTPLKSVRSFIIIKALKENFNVVDIIPSEDDIMNENFDNSFKVVLKEYPEESILEEVLTGMPDLKSWKLEGNKDTKGGKEEIEKKEEEKISKKEIIEEKTIKKENISDTSKIEDKIKSSFKKKQDIKVSLKKLDILQNLTAELVISKGALLRKSRGIDDDDLQRIVNDIANLVTSLQDEVVSMRMVPVSEVFDRYPRYVRDIAVKLGKKVNFEIKGRDIELDRSMLDTIAEPLLHLLRNAVDHGIESPEERKKKGKDEIGTIILEAKREKSSVIIEVFDDGRGIDPDILVKKAIEKGIITEEEAKHLSFKESIYLIAKSGFSTKEGVTDISGRGVGVDAVKSVLSSVGGRLEIDTKTGEWTRFRLVVPLTLAIIKAMYVKVGSEIMAIPLNYIIETMDNIRYGIYTVLGKEVCVIRNKIYPVYRLHDVYGLGGGGNTGLVVKSGDKEALFIIDELLYQQEIVVKPLYGMLSGIPHYAGVTIMGNGDPSLIIDVSSIVM